MTGWLQGINVLGTVRFAIVGGAATILYFVIAFTLSTLGVSAYLSSVAAYATASVLSYTGHRFFTFRSAKPLAETAPRFASLTFAQYILALAIPAVLTGYAGLPPLISFIAVTFVAPVISLIAMSRYVFRPSLDVGPSAIGPVKELTHV